MAAVATSGLVTRAAALPGKEDGMRSVHFSLLAVVLAIGFAASAAGASITWNFEGVVTYVDRGILDESVTCISSDLI
jgi:hypothetical protein